MPLLQEMESSPEKAKPWLQEMSLFPMAVGQVLQKPTLREKARPQAEGWSPEPETAQGRSLCPAGAKPVAAARDLFRVAAMAFCPGPNRRLPELLWSSQEWARPCFSWLLPRR